MRFSASGVFSQSSLRRCLFTLWVKSDLILFDLEDAAELLVCFAKLFRTFYLLLQLYLFILSGKTAA